MNFKIKSIPKFDRELKRLAKKYPSLKKEFSELIQSLTLAPKQGTPLGNNCYKIRIAIGSKGKGKSGGGRVIIYLQIIETTVYLLMIYDKSEQDTISDNELKEILRDLL